MEPNALVEMLSSLMAKGKWKKLNLATEQDLGGFEPAGDCHGNARSWFALHPEHQIVRGFLVVSSDVFNRHSVIDIGSEALLDVTPRPPNESQALLIFIPHDGGSPASFDKLPNQVIRPILQACSFDG